MNMEENRSKQFTQNEFSLVVEKIIASYSVAVLEKFENLENELKNYVKWSHSAIETITRKLDAQNERNEKLVRNVSCSSFREKTKEKNVENNEHLGVDKNSDNKSDSGGKISTYHRVKSLEHIGKSSTNIEKEEIFIKNINLSSKDYNASLLLGVYQSDVKCDKVVFESQGKRFWIHLDHCKPRSRGEQIIKNRLEEAIPGNQC